MRVASLALMCVLSGAGVPAMFAAKYKPPKQVHAKLAKPVKANQTAAKAKRPKLPKPPKKKAPKRHKHAA